MPSTSESHPQHAQRAQASTPVDADLDSLSLDTDSLRESSAPTSITTLGSFGDPRKSSEAPYDRDLGEDTVMEDGATGQIAVATTCSISHLQEISRSSHGAAD